MEIAQLEKSPKNFFKSKNFLSNLKITSTSLITPQDSPLYSLKAQETINDKIYVIIVLVFTENFFIPLSFPFRLSYLTLPGICGEAEISGISERSVVFLPAEALSCYSFNPNAI